jgi:hypothetical protein
VGFVVDEMTLGKVFKENFSFNLTVVMCHARDVKHAL